MPTWQMVLVGLLSIGVVIWFLPGIRHAFATRRKASAAEWMSVFWPLALVVLFVLLLISAVHH